jgi:mannose/fructose/N-acetylgalactosamine-specific phosphotransferase system component IID
MIGTLTAGWLCAKVVARDDAPAHAAAAAQVFLDQVVPRIASAAATIARPSAAITGSLEFA